MIKYIGKEKERRKKEREGARGEKEEIREKERRRGEREEKTGETEGGKLLQGCTPAVYVSMSFSAKTNP